MSDKLCFSAPKMAKMGVFRAVGQYPQKSCEGGGQTLTDLDENCSEYSAHIGGKLV